MLMTMCEYNAFTVDYRLVFFVYFFEPFHVIVKVIIPAGMVIKTK